MKLPLNLVQSEAERLEAQRECRECTACCVLPRIPIGEDDAFPQGKRGYTPCEHLCSLSGGCSIYSTRPELCRDYKCLWRGGVILGDERRRPDKLGLMFTMDQVDGKGVVEAWELWPGAAREYPGRGVIDALYGVVRLHVRFYGIPAALQYNGPPTLELGRELSDAAQHCPQAVVMYLMERITFDGLTPEQTESAKMDLEPLSRGEPVPRHYGPQSQ